MSLWTLGFQTANLLILAAVLRRFLFKPVTMTIARRQSQVDAASREAEAAKRAADESRAHFELERAKLQAQFDAMAAELRAQIGKEREKLAQQARSEAGALLESARAEIDRERREAAARTAGDAVALGVRLAARLLQQAAAAPIAETLLEQACAHLESLPIERRRSLSEEVARGAGLLEVATAPALSPEVQGRWAQRIARDLGGTPDVRFVADPDLIAGAELRFAHTRISVCWRDGLTDAREELAHADGR